MRATYVTRRGRRVRFDIATKSPEIRRLRNLQWSVAGFWLAVFFALSVLSALIVLDGDASGPEFDGLHDADRLARLPQLAVALAWFLTFLPILPVPTRQQGLRRCVWLLAATGALWIVWVLARVRK